MIKKTFIIALMLATFSAPAFAKEFTLPYKKENRWVAKDDAKDLRSLIQFAKKEKIKHFYVQLPADKRNVSLERLMVLRDILERQVKAGIVIEEVAETSTMNNIVVNTTK